VTREAYGDPTTDDDRWQVLYLKPLRAFERSVLLAEIKSEPALKNLPLVRQSRLSVMPVERPHVEHILRMGQTRLPRR
ncbi:MAG: EVE domain-containing protein, partial [Deltaproteobacteria bacterium]|nr:EVE domain-containing protein [Deltaproteobacteria bacterium]